MKKLLITALLSIQAFALTPFSLEEIKELNIKIFTKSHMKKTLPQTLKEKIYKDVVKKLKNTGIKITSKNQITLIIKIQGIKFSKDRYAIYNSISIVEDILSTRARKGVENMGITYYKEDFFESEEDLATNIYESVVDYLLDDFIEQYKEEN